MSREGAKEWLLTYRELHDNFKSTMIGRTQNDTGYTLKDPRTGEYIPRKRFNKYILPELGLTEEEYYLKYSGVSEIPLVCPVCGEPLTFISIFRGYRKCCDKKDCSGRSLIKSICEEIEMEDPDARALAVAAMHSDEAREKARLSIIEVTNKDESRRANSERQKLRYSNPEERIKTGESIRRSKLKNGTTPKGGFHKKGIRSKVYSEFEKKEVTFDSNWERWYYENSLTNSDIIKLVRDLDFVIEYYLPQEEDRIREGVGVIGHSYTPDFIQFMKTGEIWVVEIKPEKDMDDEIVKAKIKYAIPYCKSHGYRYVIFNDDLSTPHFYC